MEKIETDQQFSKTVMRQIALNIVERTNEPVDIVTTAMLVYRADSEFWDQHMEAGIGGDRMAAEQAKVDGITVEFRNAVRNAYSELQAKRSGGRHG